MTASEWTVVILLALILVAVGRIGATTTFMANDLKEQLIQLESRLDRTNSQS